MNSKLIKPVFGTFLVTYFLFYVLSHTPASWIAWTVHKASPNVWLTGVSGTIWRGQAAAAQIDLPAQSIALGEVHWQLNPVALLMLSACADITAQSAGHNIEGRVCQSFTGSTAKNVTVDMPLAWLEPMLSIPAEGQLSLQIKQAAMSAGKLTSLQGRVGVMQSRVEVMKKWYPLGDLTANLSASDKGGLAADISELRGPYKLRLAAVVDPGAEPTISGRVTPGPDAPPEVAQALQLVGEEVDGGTYRVQWP